MSPESGNGIYKELGVIRNDIGDLRDSIQDLVSSINNLSVGVTDFKKFSERIFKDSVPLKIVIYMFGILLVSLAGIEGMKWLFKAVPIP